jgi:outer membrane lipoprotein-sorting protein
LRVHFLRTTSTARLLALMLGMVVAAAATAAIALAATSGGGAKPPPKPLAQALHDALSAPKVDGVTARVKFTNHLIDSSAVVGSTPLVSGASGRLWASSDGRLRIELQSTGGDAQVVLNRSGFQVYDGSSNTAYRGDLSQLKARGEPKTHSGPPSLADVRKSIDKAKQHAAVSSATPTTVAGRPAYEVRVTPQNGGEVSAAALAWDALRGVPLEIAVYARGNSSPVLELRASSISYGPVPASVFAISPPSGAHVVDLTPRGAPGSGGGGRHGEVSGLAAVQKAVPFQLSAPGQLAGKAREDVKLIGDGALITYGQGLDGIAVIETGAASQPQQAPRSENGLRLPSVSINGSSGQELPTALGTAVRFTRGGMEYTVLGSQPSATVIAAARAL